MISAFITVTDPEKRGDLAAQCIQSADGFADEVVIIDGKESWPKEFSWPLIGEHFQHGYEQANEKWVMHLDTDFIFHERDYARIRQAIKDYPSAPAISFYKHQFVLPDRYNLKSRLALLVNKGIYGDRIRFNGGGDLCAPTLDGKDFDLNEIPQAGIPFYNYEKLIKIKKQIKDDVGRMDRAYMRHFGEWLYSENGTDNSAYAGWYAMMAGRFNKPSEKIPLSAHPKVMQEVIKDLRPEQFGYNGFGLIEGGVYA